MPDQLDSFFFWIKLQNQRMKGLTEAVMHLDFSKAFDIDPHKMLLEKLIRTALDMSINNSAG